MWWWSSQTECKPQATQPVETSQTECKPPATQPNTIETSQTECKPQATIETSQTECKPQTSETHLESKLKHSLLEAFEASQKRIRELKEMLQLHNSLVEAREQLNSLETQVCDDCGTLEDMKKELEDTQTRIKQTASEAQLRMGLTAMNDNVTSIVDCIRLIPIYKVDGTVLTQEDTDLHVYVLNMLLRIVDKIYSKTCKIIVAREIFDFIKKYPQLRQKYTRLNDTIRQKMLEFVRKNDMPELVKDYESIYGADEDLKTAIDCAEKQSVAVGNSVAATDKSTAMVTS